MRLCDIASPDTTNVSAADFRVLGIGEDLSVAGGSVVPALGSLGADTIHASHVGQLAEPSTNEAVVEVASITGSEDLAEGSRAEPVDHLAVAIAGGLEGVLLEVGVVLEGLETELSAPFVDGRHVAGVIGGDGDDGGGGRGRGRSVSGSLRCGGSLHWRGR